MALTKIQIVQSDRIVDRIADLHAALLASDSATAVLEQIFGHRVHIRRVAVPVIAPSAQQCRRLRIDSGEPCLHRRVALVAAGRTVSDADLWYLPKRLPPDMALALLETDTPFGHVVRALAPSRTTIEARICGPHEAIALEHRALLLAGGRPVAEVHERYPASAFGVS